MQAGESLGAEIGPIDMLTQPIQLAEDPPYNLNKIRSKPKIYAQATMQNVLLISRILDA
jgi:hypothetical protein